MKRILTTFLSLLLTAAVMAPAEFPAFAAAETISLYQDLPHTEVSVGALQRMDLDLNGTTQLIDRFYQELISGEDMDKEQLVSDYHQIVAAFDQISDKTVALQAQYYVTPWDAELGRQIAGYRAYLLDQESYVRSLLNVALQYEDYAFLVRELSEGEKAYIRKTTRLPKMPEEEGSGTEEAGEETADNGSAAKAPAQYPELNEADTAKVMTIRDGIADLIAQYYVLAGNQEKEPEQMAQIYLNLAAARRAMAAIMGFSDYPAYQAAFGSDVMTEETAEEVHQVIRDRIAPLYKSVHEAIESLQLSDLNGLAPSEMEKQWEALRPVIESIHPDLMEAFDNLTENHLYLRSPAAMSGYTAPLYTSNSAFIFTSPKTYLEEDYINMTHEFGHFNNDYHTVDHHIYSETHLSVRELHSQGLELLSWHHSDQLFKPEENEAYRLFLLGKKLVGILDGSVIDEMERIAYTTPGMTVEDLKAVYTDLHRQYFGEDPADPWFFTTISHIYETPFYYMHYATSALNALELWDEAFETEAAAVERYIRASAVDVWTSYHDMVIDCGLKDMQNADRIRELADRLTPRLEADEKRRNSVLQPIYEARAQKAYEEEQARILNEKQKEWEKRKRIILLAVSAAALILIPALFVRAFYRKKLKALQGKLATYEKMPAAEDPAEEGAVSMPEEGDSGENKER